LSGSGLWAGLSHSIFEEQGGAKMKFGLKPGLISFFLLLTILGACEETGPVTPSDTDQEPGTIPFSFQVQVKDSVGDPMEGLRISTHQLLSIDIVAEPNRPSLRIQMATPVNCRNTMEIFRFDGQLSRTLSDGVLPYGLHTLVWDCRDDDGEVVLDGVYEIRMTARLDEDSILYTHSEMCALLKGIDPEQEVLGFSDSMGKLIWTDRQNFPGTYELPPLFETRETPAHLDTFTVLDSMMVILVDTLLGQLASYQVPVINGKNDFNFIWIPEQAREIPGREDGVLSPYDPEILTDRESDPLRDPVVLTEFRLYTPFPNPFN
jgi:hypothetical protein